MTRLTKCRSFPTKVNVIRALATFIFALLMPISIKAEQTAPVIHVGSEINFPPYAIVDAKGRASGFSVELLEAVAEAMALSVKVTTGPWSEVLAAFKAGKTDLLPLVALSAKRADMATYTKPHTVAYDCFFVRRGSKAISSLADAKGREVIVMSSDAAHDELLASGVQVRIVESKTIPEAMWLLAAGKHDAVLVPKLLGHLVLHESKLEGVIEAGQPIGDYNRQFAFAVQRGNTDLRDRLDQGIAIIRATGEYDAIYKKWFGGIDTADRFDWRIIMWGAGGLILLALFASGWVLSYRRQMALKKSEQVQSELLEKLNQAQQLAMVGSWEWNLSTNKVWWSDETYRIFGVTQQDFVPDFEANGTFIHPDDLANYGSSFEHSLQTGEPLDINVRLIVGDGETKHCQAKGKIIYDISGKPIRFVGTIMDTTERKRTEDSLRDTNSYLENLINYANAPIIVWDPQFRITRFNNAFEFITGRGEAEVLGQSLEILFPPARVAQSLELIRQTLTGERWETVEIPILHVSGSIRIALWNSATIFAIDGMTPIATIAQGQDITERKQAEDALKVSEERYRFALEVTGQIGWSTPPDGVVEDLPLWRQYSGQSMEEVKGWKWLDAVHPDDRESAYKAWSSAAAQKCNYSTEYRIRRADGVYRNFLVRGIPLLNSDGSCREWVGTCIDITERKLIEQELRDKNAEMERFAYTVSHDLKSPLITIQTYAGMIAKDMESGKYERAIGDMKRIEDAASKMNALMGDLLELSRAGRQMSESSQVDMNLLVKDTLGQLAGPLKQHQVEVVVQSDLPAVHGDQKRIAEVVQNLIENAIKYRGDQATPRIEIGVRQEGKESVFFVCDNGAGIDQLHHERIFGLFNKLDAESAGTGVGLALVKRIIEVHGGRVWVESEGEGLGSCFCFTVGL